jgi:tripartite-type tricarboxylate transporter receptor subunit TctC
MKTNQFIFAFTIVLQTLFTQSVFAQSSDYPNRSITLITPFPAGGSTDIVARIISKSLSTQLGQSVIVDNRPGAGGSIGCDVVAKAKSDGYTLLITSSSTHAIGAALAKKVPFDYDADFTPIIHAATSPHVFLVTKQIGVKTLPEFMAYAKKNPESLNFSSAGTGTIMHLTGEMFNSDTGTHMMHIPYKGSSLSMPDLISGKVQVLFDALVSALPSIQDGKLTVLAVTSRKRTSLLPNVPTLMEIGGPYNLGNFVSENIWGFYGPKNLPPQILEKLNTALNKTLKDPEVIKQLVSNGAEVGGGSALQFKEQMLTDRAKWAKIIKEQRIEAD